MAGVEFLLLTECFARFATSFALTEAICVSQLVCLSWLQSFRFFFRAYVQYNDANVTKPKKDTLVRSR